MIGLERKRLNLKSVTLYSCFWGGNLAILKRICRVLRYCQSVCSFEKTVLITAVKPPSEFDFTIIQIPSLFGISNWNIFANKTLPRMLTGDFVLSVHDDGFILEPRLWSNSFLKYDYVGAPWHDGVVGNGGFCLESKRMLQAKLMLPPDFGTPPIASDYFVCRKHRAFLERSGISFAPKELALEFSTELVGGRRSSFGFHGRQNISGKFDVGWKKIEAEENKSRVELASTRNKTPRIGLMTMYPLDNRADFKCVIQRWVETYKKFRPETPHTFVICMNGGDPTEEDKAIFSDIECKIVKHGGTGWDIGSYQCAAAAFDFDLMIFTNTRVHFWKHGWMERLVDAYKTFGPNGLYGASASYEACPLKNWEKPNPHIRTSCFATNPMVLRTFPHYVNSRDDGFRFESGEWNFSKWYAGMGWPVKMVTWDGFYDSQDWRKPPNIFRRGDQSNCIVWDRHTQLYFDASPDMKAVTENAADGI